MIEYIYKGFRAIAHPSEDGINCLPPWGEKPIDGNTCFAHAGSHDAYFVSTILIDRYSDEIKMN